MSDFYDEVTPISEAKWRTYIDRLTGAWPVIDHIVWAPPVAPWTGGGIREYADGLADLPTATFEVTWLPSEETWAAYLRESRRAAIRRLRATVAERRRQRWNRKRRSR